LKEIHKNNIVHCDIKPQNFLVFENNDNNYNNDNEIADKDKEEKNDNITIDLENVINFNKNLNIVYNSYNSIEQDESYINSNQFIKISDFGLAHIIPSNQDNVYVKYACGTHSYIAPEIKNVKY
jgi:serine/threonine protein kinase